MAQAEAGKGSSPRPFNIPFEQYSNNWDAIFGKKEEPKEKEEDNENN